jgi:hypothetical protein
MQFHSIDIKPYPYLNTAYIIEIEAVLKWTWNSTI